MKSRAFLEFCGKGFCLDFLALSCVIVLLQSHLQNSFFHVKNLLDFFFFFFSEVWDDICYSRDTFENFVHSQRL